MSRIRAAAPAFPEHVYSQSAITDGLLPMLEVDAGRTAVLRRVHASSGVGTRHLAMPLERYGALASFDESNDLFIQVGTDLAERAVVDALAQAGLEASDVDFLLFTTVTGVSAPSLDVELVRRTGMRSDVKRLPSFGLGCVAGAAGIARVHDYLAGHPDDVAVLVSVELCSLTLQRGDQSMANIVASGLFGDGAAAVVMVGDARAARDGVPGPDVVDTSSRIYADTADVIGWDIGGTGFRIVLAAGVPDVIDREFAGDAVGLLAQHDLGVADVGVWIAHPGGPKVLQAFAQALDVDDALFGPSWDCLASYGNLSSAAVLTILADVLASGPHDGDAGLLFALGPGVTAELVLLRWPSSGSDPALAEAA